MAVFTVLLRLVKKLRALRWTTLARWLLATALAVAPRHPALLRELAALLETQGNERAAAGAYRRLLGVCPDDDQALEKLATLELASGNIAAARELLAAHPRAQQLGLRLVEDALIDVERARRDGVYVATLRNVEVETAYWSILDGDLVYNVEAHNRGLPKSPFVQGRATADGKAFLYKLPPVSKVIAEPCVYLAGDHNYAHWIMRNLPKLALLEGTPYTALPLLVNEDLQPHQRAYLQLLNIPDERLIKVPRFARIACRELVVPTNLINHVKMDMGLQWLRGRVASCLDTRPPADLLFVSRHDAKVRRILNEDAIEAALAALGFSSMTPGEIPVPEQIRRFSRARIVVGAHGAGISNFIFCAPGTHVIEINSTFKSHIFDFTLLARAAQVELSTVLSDDYDFTRPEPYYPDTDFRADVDAVVTAVKRLMQ